MKTLTETRPKDSRAPLEWLWSALKRISRFVHYGRAAGLALLTVALAHKALAQSGSIERGTITTAALVGNLFNDPTNRPYAVYLPPSYGQGQRRYPVFYMLHGTEQNLDTYLGVVQATLDSMIQARQIGEMIAVFVDGQNALLGSFYRTSTATGDYETYIARDLVNLIDARYRTLATNASRGLCGFSMGGYGAMHLALNFPNTFSVVVAQSGYYDTTDAGTDGALKQIARVNPMTFAAIASQPESFRGLFAFLPSAVPNPSRPPFYYDAPYSLGNGRYTTNQNTLQRLRDADIVHGDLGRFLQGTTRLRAIKFLHGTSDSLIPISQARTLHQALLSAGLDHIYEEHVGWHQFLADRSLTFLSQSLAGAELYISPPRAVGNVIRVPGDYPTIQAAVKAAVSGDEIQIAAGVYHEQIVVSRKKLTITGEPGTIIQAWDGMVHSRNFQGYILYEFISSDVTVRNIDFEGNRAANPVLPDHLVGLFYGGSGGRVENCVIRGFRGTNDLRGVGLNAYTDSTIASKVVDLQVSHNTFADNGHDIKMEGDHFEQPNRLRMTVSIEDNTLTGIGPTPLGELIGIQIEPSVAGAIKNNRIANYYYTGPSATDFGFGILAYDSSRFLRTNTFPLQPLRFENNIFVDNQVALTATKCDNGQFINNFFQGPGGGLTSSGLGVSGANLGVRFNQFTNLTR